jgi:ribosomal protein L37E
MTKKSSKEDAISRMMAVFDSTPSFTEEQIKKWSEIEDAAACKKCGRVIYCGASKLCSDPECGLKNGNKER